MEQLSVVIITYNEEANIGTCIDAVKGIADEIIVLDSFSTDDTVKIAKAKGARVSQQEFAGYIGQKNRALSLASNHFVLSLDADEVVSEQLSASILKAKETFTFSAYKMIRCANYCGQFIRHGTWYPNRKIRLFDKRIGYWGGINPHDKIVFNQPVAVKQLEGEILHYSFKTVEEHRVQNIRFSNLAAQSLYEAGRKTNALKILINPAWAFLNGYVFHAGFLNGKTGFTISANQAKYTFLKHSKLYRLQKTVMRIPPGSDAKKELSDIQTSTNADRLSRDVRSHVRS
jgi:glycosyltransferase involved in cell wall biosynthesis